MSGAPRLRDRADDRADDRAGPEIVLAIGELGEALRERLAAALGGVEGLRLTASARDADAVIVPARGAEPERPGWEPDLTPRETQVLAVLAEGASNRQIAERLGISVHTAKFHVGAILDKLDAAGRTDAVAQAARLGVLRL